ncbi:MAG: glycosyltransferase [Patescibacteria group bacterium]
MKISIIIPTLNEEKYIVYLLKDIKKQTFTDYEVIVADAGSKDKTRAIAKKYKARVVAGGLPAVGRNRGAAVAQGEYLFFFDADVRLPADFLQKAYAEMQERGLDIASCEFLPISDLLVDRVLHRTVNTFFKIHQFTYPHAPGFCTLVTKEVFNKAGGFDEEIKIAEDHDFSKRAAYFGLFRVLFSTHIRVSVRRLKKEGRIGISKKYLQTELYRYVLGELKTDIVEYEFDKFDDEKKSFLEKNLIRLDKKLVAINKSLDRVIYRRAKKGMEWLGVKKYLSTARHGYNRVFEELVKLLD